MKALFRKTLTGLVPVDEQGESMLAKWKLGDMIMVEARKPRNPQHHRLFWALANIVANNTERYPNAERFVDACKIYAGHYDEITLSDGRVALFPKSIAFASMAQDEFDVFFERSLDMASKVLGVDAPDIQAEVMEIAA